MWVGACIDMRYDAFSRCHPAVNFGFFAIAIVLSVILVHPAYLAVSAVCAAAYYLALKGYKGWKAVLGMVPLFFVVALLNPLFTAMGDTVLFSLFGRPFTYESLVYGACIAAMLVSVLLWFLCYGAVMTSDKFTSLFANVIPALSLILVMVLRLVPSYGKKARQISGARQCIGKSGSGTKREKLQGGVTVLSALTGWALEGSVVTADSMRARGYGAGKRTTFQVYRLTLQDGVIALLLLLFAAVTIAAAAAGAAQAAFLPSLHIAPVRGALSVSGLGAWGLFLLLPTLLHLREVILWHTLTSDI